jgi:uncharacterized protein YwqG
MTDIYKWLFGPRGRRVLDEPPSPLWDLPDILAPFRADIEATVLPYIAVSPLETAPEAPNGSQLGGLPWWPRTQPYPCAVDGHTPLHLLIQIDCTDLPPATDLPRQGLLQVFIGGDETYGCSFFPADAPSDFRCVYHRETSLAPLEPSEHVRLGPPHSPLTTPLASRALLFSASAMAIDPSDHRFSVLLGAIDEDPRLRDAYHEWHAAAALRLGGYPTFVQDDPRGHSRKPFGDRALLTMDTTDGLMWGDSGAAQFLIRAEDLARRDFSRVTYNWDCC